MAAALRQYSPAELRAATGGFCAAACIGGGGFGRVFRAMLNGVPVAIKLLDWTSLQARRAGPPPPPRR